MLVYPTKMTKNITTIKHNKGIKEKVLLKKTE